jgi:hypothetical protein
MNSTNEVLEAAAKAIRDAVDPTQAAIIGPYAASAMQARAAIEAAAPYMVIHIHHHDIEAHATSRNEGYEAAVTQGLADDPSLADDWFQEKLREAKATAWDEGWDTLAGFDSRPGGPYPANPYRTTP